MDEKEKKEYELAVLVKNEGDLAPVVTLVRQHNGEILTEPRAKKLALAYEIKKNKEAIFAYCTFRAETSDAKNLERDLNTKAEVMRSLIIASPPPPESRGRRPAEAPGAHRALRPGNFRRKAGRAEAAFKRSAREKDRRDLAITALRRRR